MRICKDHWQMMRASVEEKGMGELVAKDGQTALENTVAEANGEKAPFDPLMSHYWHWTSLALSAGGLYVMEVNPELRPDNDGHYCPMCEWKLNVPEIDPKKEIDTVSDQMAEYCREQGLIPKVN